MHDMLNAGLTTTTYPEFPEHLINRTRERKLAPGSDNAHSSGIARVSQDVFCESLVDAARALLTVRKENKYWYY